MKDDQMNQDQMEETQMEEDNQEDSGQKQTGTVKWFSAEKGYGFIQPDEDGQEDVFVHRSQVPFSGVMEGQKVKFNVETTDKGLSATNVEVVA